MDAGVRKSLFWILGFIALLLGLFLASFMAPKTLSKEELQALGYYRFDKPRVIQDFSLVDYNNQPVSLSTIRGNWSLLFFGFTYCPDVCPTTLSVLNEAVSKMPSPPRVILVSVDPERDTPAQLKGYVTGFNTNFLGFTGSFDNIVSLATAVNVAFGKVPGTEPGSYTIDHSASIVVMDPKGRYAGFIKYPHNAQNIQKIVDTFH